MAYDNRPSWEKVRNPRPKPEPELEPWRRMDADARAELLAWAQAEMAERLAIGQDKYKSEERGFRGDPLDHLENELLDALVYAWYVRRQRDGG